MSARRSVAANTAFLLSADIVHKVLMTIFMILAARYLGVKVFGMFSFALTVVLILSSISSLGMKDILVREVARNKGLTSHYLLNALVMRLAFSGMFTLISWGLIWIMDTSIEIHIAAYILSVYIVLEAISDTCGSIFRAHERMDYVGYLSITRGILVCILGILFLIYGYGLKGAALAYVGGAAASASFAALVALRRYLEGGHLRIDLTLCFTLIKQALPLSLAAMLAIIYFRIDIIMLGIMKNDTVVGWYSASYRLFETLSFIPIALTTSLLPLMSRLKNVGLEKIEDIAQKALKYLIVISIPIVIGTVMLAQPIIHIIYGDAYSNSVPALQILVIAIPFVYLNNVLNATLISTDRQQIVGINAALCVVVNIFLNLALIPSQSYKGAAMTTVITELALIVSNVYFCSRQIKILPAFRGMPLVLICGLIMAAFLEATKGLMLPVKVLGAAIIYFCFSWLLGSIKIGELSIFFRRGPAD
jgi:O-antigen/teichoic acid export membrane protein